MCSRALISCCTVVFGLEGVLHFLCNRRISRVFLCGATSAAAGEKNAGSSTPETRKNFSRSPSIGEKRFKASKRTLSSGFRAHLHAYIAYFGLRRGTNTHAAP